MNLDLWLVYLLDAEPPWGLLVLALAVGMVWQLLRFLWDCFVELVLFNSDRGRLRKVAWRAALQGAWIHHRHAVPAWFRLYFRPRLHPVAPPRGPFR